MTADQWISGVNLPVPKISLDPSKREKGEEPIIVMSCSPLLLFVSIIIVTFKVHRGDLAKLREDFEASKAARKPAKPKVVESTFKAETHPVRSIVKEMEPINKTPTEEINIERDKVRFSQVFFTL